MHDALMITRRRTVRRLAFLALLTGFGAAILAHQGAASLTGERVAGVGEVAGALALHPTGAVARDPAALLSAVEARAASLARGGFEMTVVLSDEAVKLLALARRDAAVAARVDALKARGVRFAVSRDTLFTLNLLPSELHGVGFGDVVPSATAALTDLWGRGFRYERI